MAWGLTASCLCANPCTHNMQDLNRLTYFCNFWKDPRTLWENPRITPAPQGTTELPLCQKGKDVSATFGAPRVGRHRASAVGRQATESPIVAGTGKQATPG